MVDVEDAQYTVKRYERKRNEIQASRVVETNVKQLAVWCGGEVIKPQLATSGSFDAYVARTPNDTPILRVPSLYGVFEVGIGDWLVQDEDGRFTKFGNKEFQAIYKVATPIEGE